MPPSQTINQNGDASDGRFDGTRQALDEARHALSPSRDPKVKKEAAAHQLVCQLGGVNDIIMAENLRNPQRDSLIIW